MVQLCYATEKNLIPQQIECLHFVYGSLLGINPWISCSYQYRRTQDPTEEKTNHLDSYYLEIPVEKATTETEQRSSSFSDCQIQMSIVLMEIKLWWWKSIYSIVFMEIHQKENSVWEWQNIQITFFNPIDFVDLRCEGSIQLSLMSDLFFFLVETWNVHYVS